MSVKIMIDKFRIQRKIDSAWKKSLPIMSEEILNDCNDYVKFDSGALLASSYIHSRFDQGLLIWQTPYARRQYWEIRTAYTDTNPRATWKWCEAAKKANFDKWQKQAQRLMEMNL